MAHERLVWLTQRAYHLNTAALFDRMEPTFTVLLRALFLGNHPPPRHERTGACFIFVSRGVHIFPHTPVSLTT